MDVSWQVSEQFFSKATQNFSKILNLHFKGQNLTELSFSEKFSFLGKNPKFIQNRFFLFLSKILSISVSFFTLEMAHNSVFYDSLKTQLLEKVWFFSYGLKCSELIRLYYSLIISIFGKNQLISQIFCIEVIIKKRQLLRVPLWVGCCQLFLLSNQIPGFLDHLYPKKKSGSLLEFLHADSPRVEVASEFTSYRWICQLCLSFNQVSGFFLSLERIK